MSLQQLLLLLIALALWALVVIAYLGIGWQFAIWGIENGDTKEIKRSSPGRVAVILALFWVVWLIVPFFDTKRKREIEQETEAEKD